MTCNLIYLQLNIQYRNPSIPEFHKDSDFNLKIFFIVHLTAIYWGGSESFPFPFRSFPKLLKPFPVADYSFPGKGKDPFLSQNYWNLSQLQTTPFLGKERILSFPKITEIFPSCSFPKIAETFPSCNLNCHLESGHFHVGHFEKPRFPSS